MNQTEILKKYFIELFEELDKVEVKTFMSGPRPTIDRRKMNIFTRLLQLNTWLFNTCAVRGLHYIENFDLFWKRDDLFKGNGPHLSRVVCQHHQQHHNYNHHLLMTSSTTISPSEGFSSITTSPREQISITTTFKSEGSISSVTSLRALVTGLGPVCDSPSRGFSPSSTYITSPAHRPALGPLCCIYSL
ncbi:hypothetical protein NQD34_010111 [Periophthalmus magnuspinnatus]|nr:hypothetical protein NQD34_010111 [Periophthalmus magnuspinnatus]